jgi:4-alpha-glucanotransferase
MEPSPLFRSGRHAGLLLPLFAAAGRQSWGIGEIGDLPVLSAWLREAGFDFLQVLPLNEMQPPEHSPYSALSAMAIDPVFISLRQVPEFRALGGEDALPAEARDRLAQVRRSSRIDYDGVRALKAIAIRAAFERFRAREWAWKTSRGVALLEYVTRQAWWLQDYVLYRALRDRYQSAPWWEWEPIFALRDGRALEHARDELKEECLFHSYVQWLADTQWQEARLAGAPTGVFGDMPFMVGRDSADLWARQHAFRLDASVGAPPDAFSETGQDWSLPAYRWDVMAAEDDAWIRARATRYASLFDGYRVDHLVGFYRTYIIPDDGTARMFSPVEASDQLAQGERIMRALLDSGATVIAEDLGTVPAFVRESLVRLSIPGYKVLRWEREWKAANRPFNDPAQSLNVSVATTGTHDTETLADWWDTAPVAERTLVARIPFLAARSLNPEAAFNDEIRDLLLEALVASASNLLIFPLQDLFGWRDRINVPGTVSNENWTWRLPWPVEELRTRYDACAIAHALWGWMQRYDRGLDRPSGVVVNELSSTTGRGRNELSLSQARRFRSRDQSRAQHRSD